MEIHDPNARTVIAFVCGDDDVKDMAVIDMLYLDLS